MPSTSSLLKITQHLEPRLHTTIQELVRIPSENTPPLGAELGCQEYLRERGKALSLQTQLYDLSEVPGLRTHTAFRHDRDYSRRPNLACVLKGSGGGKSLILSGHIDTVPRGVEPWNNDPFSAAIIGERLYGLGANDMKGGIAAALIAIEAIQEAGIRLRGDVIFESVVDEEFGGVNGTLAARLKGYNADAAIVMEPTQNEICPAHLGGRIAHLTLRAPDGGILETSKAAPRVADQLEYILREIKNFEALRRSIAPKQLLYRDSPNPVPVWILKINAGGWGTQVPMTIPQVCRMELYWQMLPGEELSTVDQLFNEWLNDAISKRGDLFLIPPEVTYPIEWLPGSQFEPNEAVTPILASAYERATGHLLKVAGFGAPCDTFIFHQHFHTPAILFGPKGGNTHQPDEWVDLQSAMQVSMTLAEFIADWCA